MSYSSEKRKPVKTIDHLGQLDSKGIDFVKKIKGCFRVCLKMIGSYLTVINIISAQASEAVTL